VLGQQTVCEISSSGAWQRGYVYLGGQLLTIQDVPQNRVLWTHQEPYSKAQRITDAAGAFVSGVEVEPFGLETNRSFDWNGTNQKRKFTTYDRDANGGDEAMFRRYAPKQNRFAQPDPYDGSNNLHNPQSFNRYAYTEGDPIRFVDPSGLNLEAPDNGYYSCIRYHYSNGRGQGFWGGWNCTFVGSSDTGGSGAPLNSKDKAKYDKEKEKLRDKLNKKKQDCLDLLAKAGLTLEQVQNAINDQRPFDGTTSSSITLGEAGLLPENVADASQIVQQFFADHAGGSFAIWAVTAIFGQTSNDVYYRPGKIRPSLILHEALHSVTNNGDIDLAARLGLGNFAKPEDASRAITSAVKKAGCA
jgi:RHS repeat-associated protein